MRDVDRKTAALGIPGIVLMENAGCRVVELLQEKFRPLHSQRIVVVCGKGNNGGDGLVIARQLFTRFQPLSLDVVLIFDPSEYKGDAALNFGMLQACGCPFTREFSARLGAATLVVDAVLGTGLEGPASGAARDAIHAINTQFPAAQVVAVDIPSGLPSPEGEFVRADFTVTFTALKVAHATGPACNRMGEIHIAPIGSPGALMESSALAEVAPADFRHLLATRPKDSNKGMYGHVLVVAGSRGRTGAAAMAGISALRAGAGLVTVATAASALPQIANYAPELMTDALRETGSGAIADQEVPLERKTVLAIGPGLGTEAPTAALARRLFRDAELPMVVDADALNALAGAEWKAPGHLRVLTPHPGEMSRLCGKPTAQVQQDRFAVATAFAAERGVVLVLKGDRTLIAFPDGRVWINPTGSPAMATGGSGDVLTGVIAGFLAQHPREPDLAIAAAVYLHGRAGELGAAELTEQVFLATDILRYLPNAIHAVTDLHHTIRG